MGSVDCFCTSPYISRQAHLQSQLELLSQWDAAWEAKWLLNTFEYNPDAVDSDGPNKYCSALYPSSEMPWGKTNFVVTTKANIETFRTGSAGQSRRH